MPWCLRAGIGPRRSRSLHIAFAAILRFAVFEEGGGLVFEAHVDDAALVGRVRTRAGAPAAALNAI
jgi:hypothetical protein